MNFRDHLVLLVAIHLSMVLSFAEIAGSTDEMSRANFERLLVWNFQYMRFAAAEAEPDLDHPSVQVMPVFAFPRVDGAIAETVSKDRVEAVGNDRPDVLADMVVALAGGDGVLGLLRFPSTDRRRMGELTGAVLAGDLAGARQALEELWIFHGGALDFDRQDDADRATEFVLSLGDSLLGSPEELSPGEPLVRSFFSQAEELVRRRRPKLSGEGTVELRDWWAGGWEGWLERQMADLVVSEPTIDQAVRRVINRVAARLGDAM